jgi:deazaflavin-dependent oxidoreductase (nitroreductase family)
MADASAGAKAKDGFFRLWTGVHRGIFKATKGRVFGGAFGMSVLILITTGAKSGKRRETMLTAPLQRGNEVVLVASYGGDPRHPAWYHNLMATPECEVIMRGSKRRMRARVATTDEKDELWPKITAAYKGYAGYQKRTDRDIPVLILSPA